ncbi:chemotaxis protein CheW [Vallitalea okinawensis]|uniref:chemotaxis protein CheW n=1 Tax=Vallitalea okinawensis TaxID=2078660 RepID=UPI000CFB0A62|nr:chemotaxis protein CheW [Vallitalea okinawensis]
MATQQVVFRLDNESYGVAIMKVYGIEKFQEILKIPNTPTYIEGVINLRGEVLPIYNLRKKFNLEEKAVDGETKIIITKANDMQVGFIVDSVSEIINIEDDVIEEAPKIITGIERKYIRSIAKVNERMIILLDIDLILSEEELEAAKEAAVSTM